MPAAVGRSFPTSSSNRSDAAALASSTAYAPSPCSGDERRMRRSLDLPVIGLASTYDEHDQEIKRDPEGYGGTDVREHHCSEVSRSGARPRALSEGGDQDVGKEPDVTLERQDARKEEQREAVTPLGGQLDRSRALRGAAARTSPD